MVIFKLFGPKSITGILENVAGIKVMGKFAMADTLVMNTLFFPHNSNPVHIQSLENDDVAATPPPQ